MVKVICLPVESTTKPYLLNIPKDKLLAESTWKDLGKTVSFSGCFQIETLVISTNLFMLCNSGYFEDKQTQNQNLDQLCPEYSPSNGPLLICKENARGYVNATQKDLDRLPQTLSNDLKQRDAFMEQMNAMGVKVFHA